MKLYFLNLKGFNPLDAGEMMEDIIIPHNTLIFPAGEPHVKLDMTSIPSPNDDDLTTISMQYKSWEDIGMLQMAVSALREAGFKRLVLMIPYLPAARQDRVAEEGDAFGLKVVADVINSLNFERVGYYDGHSPVAEALIDNKYPINNHEFISRVLNNYKQPNDVVLVSPDAGAHKKLLNLVKNLGLPNEIILATKSRDTLTGKLTRFNVPNDISISSKDVLIIDDICDGGATFLGLADELATRGFSSLSLAVTHGIFSKGFERLGEYFDKIYTTHSYPGNRQEGLTIEIEYL